MTKRSPGSLISPLKCFESRVYPENCRERNRRPAALFHSPDYRDLLRSHDELRAAVILAGKRIQKFNFRKRDDKTLPVLRRTLEDARAIAR